LRHSNRLGHSESCSTTLQSIALRISALRTDSSAKILTSGLLGEQYIGIEAGGDDQMLAQGSKITQTQSAIVLENLISQFLYNKAADAGKDKDQK